MLGIRLGAETPRVSLLSDNPEHHLGAVALLEEYLRLPDGWGAAGAPRRLPRVLDRQISAFPGEAVPPFGDVVVADAQGKIAAAGHVVRLDAERCEFTRLYVRPEYREAGLGRRVVEAMIGRARTLSYTSAVVHVLPGRTAALGLWDAMDFRKSPPYRDYGFPMESKARSLTRLAELHT